MSVIARTSLRSSNLPLDSRTCSSSKDRSKWSSIERFPRPVMIRMSSRPKRTASSTTYWIAGLSRSGSISLGCAFVAGRKRVPRPAAGITALRILFIPSPCRPRWEPECTPMWQPRYPRTAVPNHGAVGSLGYTFERAHLRVRLHRLRTTCRGLPALLRGAADHLRGVRRTAAQGVPPRRDRVQGFGVLRHRQPLGLEVEGRRLEGEWLGVVIRERGRGILVLAG